MSGIYPLQFRFEDKVLEGLLNHRARFDLELFVEEADGATLLDEPADESAAHRGARS